MVKCSWTQLQGYVRCSGYLSTTLGAVSPIHGNPDPNAHPVLIMNWANEKDQLYETLLLPNSRGYCSARDRYSGAEKNDLARFEEARTWKELSLSKFLAEP